MTAPIGSACQSFDQKSAAYLPGFYAGRANDAAMRFVHLFHGLENRYAYDEMLFTYCDAPALLYHLIQEDFEAVNNILTQHGQALPYLVYFPANFNTLKDLVTKERVENAIYLWVNTRIRMYPNEIGFLELSKDNNSFTQYGEAHFEGVDKTPEALREKFNSLFPEELLPIRDFFSLEAHESTSPIWKLRYTGVFEREDYYFKQGEEKKEGNNVIVLENLDAQRFASWAVATINH